MNAFGQGLRAWRKRRGVSQLELAGLAGTTPRYVSFLETGRSRPGREMVLRLSEAMDIPLSERNTLLRAAGLQAAYTERQLDHQALVPVWRVIDRVLERHEPFPASVLSSGLRFVKQNRAAERLFPGACALSPAELLHQSFAPGPGREALENWHEILHHTIAGLRQEILENPHPDLPELLAIAESYLDRSELPEISTESPVVCSTLLIGKRKLRCMSTVMRFDRPVDTTTGGLRIELMFPADMATEELFRKLAEE